MGDVMTREQELAEEFKTGLSPDDVPALAARIAGLEKAAAEAETEWGKQRESLLADTSAALEARDAAEQRAAAAATTSSDADHPAIVELQASVETLTEQLATANARADKAEAATKKAQAKVTSGEVPARLRKLKDGAFAGDRDALKEAIAAGEKVEIAFSDGRHEVPGVAPLTVEGEVWRDHQRGLMLRDPVTVTGPSLGTSTTIAGYALMIDGKQVAYTERSDPLTIAPGQRISLADDIYF